MELCLAIQMLHEIYLISYSTRFKSGATVSVFLIAWAERVVQAIFNGTQVSFSTISAQTPQRVVRGMAHDDLDRRHGCAPPLTALSMSCPARTVLQKCNFPDSHGSARQKCLGEAGQAQLGPFFCFHSEEARLGM